MEVIYGIQAMMLTIWEKSIYNFTCNIWGHGTISTDSGGSSIGRTRRTSPPPIIGENIAFSCIFLE